MIKSINLQHNIKGENGLPIATLNSQIGLEYDGLNISVHVIDKANLELNQEIFKTQFDSFMENVKNEAIANGWIALK